MRFYQRDFPATTAGPAMTWLAEQNDAGDWEVQESYDDGATWVCNCAFDSLFDAIRFIDDWCDGGSQL